MAGFVALAQVPYTGVPTGTDAGPGNLREDIPSTPADFGGSIGAAEQKLGADIGSGGEKVFQAGIAQQEMYNKASVQNATNAALDIGNTTLYDPKTGYLTMQGKTAMEAYPTTVANIKSKFQGIRDNLANDMQRTMFDSDARRYMYYYERAAGAHADTQAKQWYKNEDNATQVNAIQTSALAYNDPAVTQANLDRGYQSIAQTVARDQIGPQESELMRRTYQSKFALEQLRSQALTDPGGALARYNSGTLPGSLTIDPSDPTKVIREPPMAVKDLVNRAQGGDSFIQTLMTAGQKSEDAAYIRGLMGGGAAPAGGGGSYRPGTPFTPKTLPSNISLNEDAMVRTVAGEAGAEPLVGQQAVASVIMNRANGAGVSPRDVVFAPNQFEPWNGGAARARLEAMNPSSPEYQNILNNVVRPVMSGQTQDPTGGATHFYAPVAQSALGRSAPSWATGTPTVIGGHNFYKVGYGPGSAPPHAAINDNAAPPSPGAQPPVSGVINPSQQSPAEAALPDIDKIVERVQHDFPDDIVRQEKLVAQVKSQYNLMLSATQNERKDLVSSVHDMMAAAVSGQDITINEAHIRHLLPPAVAAQTIEELNTSVSAGQQFKALQWGTPQQVTDAYQKMSAGLGANPRGDRIAQATLRGETVGEELPPEPTEDQNTPEQYRYRQRLQNMFAAKMLQRNQMLATDSYGYVSQNPIVQQKATVLSAAADAAKGAPETDPRAVAAKVAMNDLFRTSLNIQEQLGVPAPLQHIMTKARAQSVAQDLMNADPATTDVGASLDKMGKDYGPFWNQAYGDIKTLGKLPPDYQVLAMTVDPVARNDVQRMLTFVHEKGGVEKLHDLAGKNNMQLINNAIEDSPGPLRDFIRSINVPGIYGNGDAADMTKNAVRNLAAYRTMGGSTDGTAAAEKAAADLIGAKYDFDDRLRVPKGTMRPVENYGDTMLHGLSGNDIRADDGRRTVDIASSSIPGVDDRVQRHLGGEIGADKKVEVWRRVRDTGKWVTNESDSGAFLTAQSAEGVPYIVRRPDGKRIEFSFKDAVAGNLPRPSTPDPLMMIP